jgi:Domain of unknown function (DUF4166)
MAASPLRATRPAPWAVALGARVDELHPQIRDYVGGTATGRIGRGVGTFEVVGTPRRWLWPMLALLARQGVLVPAWRRDVPFTVTNRLSHDGTLTAERTFELPGGSWTMHDAVSVQDGELVDDLGTAARYRAHLRAWAENGALRLRSTHVSLRIGGAHLRLPTVLAPVVQLREGFDAAAGRQRVHLRLEHPALGVLYEYRGTFDYRVEEEAP